MRRNKIDRLLRSRKFWTTVLATIVAVAATFGFDLPKEMIVYASAFLAAVYQLAVALEDGLSRMGDVRTWNGNQ